jgi:hypothetical protein
MDQPAGARAPRCCPSGGCESESSSFIARSIGWPARTDTGGCLGSRGPVGAEFVVQHDGAAGGVVRDVRAHCLTLGGFPRRCAVDDRFGRLAEVGPLSRTLAPTVASRPTEQRAGAPSGAPRTAPLQRSRPLRSRSWSSSGPGHASGAAHASPGRTTRESRPGHGRCDDVATVAWIRW